jgi:threonine dehydrogenase-like Zn-dependent dehydrogenase
MQRLEFIKKNQLEWREVPTPIISGLNQAIIRPLAVSRCDLDLPILRGQTLFRAPFPIGHEFVGEISSLSDDLADVFKIGMKVAIPFQISCGHCHYCKTERSKSCSSVPHASTYGMGKSGKDFGGALTDAVLVPYAKEMLVPIKDSTDLVSIASISDNLVEAWKLAGIFLNANKNQSVLILGGAAASISLYTASLAKFMGAPEILYMDTDVSRLQLAESMDVKVEQVKEFPKATSKRYDIVAEASGTKEGWMCGLRSLDVDGKFGSASIFWSNDFPIPYLDLYNFGATINIGRVKSREWIPEILRLVEDNGYNPSNVVTRTGKWEDAKDAFLLDESKLVIVR